MRGLAAAEARAAQAPGSLREALTLAQRYIEASRQEGDPRYLGAAEAALASFTALADPPPEVRLLRATISQSRHAFDAALGDLDRALALRPNDAQAWLTRATVWTVKGNYEQARASCAALTGLTSELVAIACVAPIDLLTGHAARARAALQHATEIASTPEERGWLHSLTGEHAFWRGDLGESERLLRATLANTPQDRFSRALLADVLLDAGRAAEASALVARHGEDDALALRDALAQLALGREEHALVRRVADGFAESRLRGDAVHQREEARLWLARGDATSALRYAQESWAVQHEAWDARVLLEAAVAAGRPAAATPVLTWLDTTGFEAPRLRALAARLRSMQ
jgi:tetratricopeptide (TPR) repeat protein